MTAVDMNPYWPATEDWTGFLLVIAPSGRITVSGAELRRQVLDQLALDAVLYDLVTVAVAPPFAPTTDWDRALLTRVVEAAMPDRHLFAPSGAVTFVVVAEQKEAMEEARDRLKSLRILDGLNALHSSVRAGPDAVVKIANATERLVERYEVHPEVALAERTFLDWVDAAIAERQLVLPALEPKPAPTIPPRSTVTQPSAWAEPVATTVPGPRQTPAVYYPPDPPPAPPVPPAAREVPAILDDDVEIVTIDKRTAMQKLKRQTIDDVDTLDALGRDGRAVALVHLIFVPDDGVVPGRVAKRRNAIALEIDQALTSVCADDASGLSTHAATEVFTATSPVQKYGVLRRAGELTESALPKVEIEYFSVAETVKPFIDAADRTARALEARDLETVSRHLIFLAATRFPTDDGAKEDWVRLLNHARVTWIDFSPPEERERLKMPSSPYGLHVLTDREDVVAVIKQRSEVLYGYAPAPTVTREIATVDDGDEDAAPAKTRWGWPFGRKDRT